MTTWEAELKEIVEGAVTFAGVHDESDLHDESLHAANVNPSRSRDPVRPSRSPNSFAGHVATTSP